MRLLRKVKNLARGQSGLTFIETLVALMILGVVSVAFLDGLTTSSKSVFTADEQTTAESLASGQMEWAKTAPYLPDAMEYTPAPIPGGGDYVNYSVNITAEPRHDPDEGIQKITVTIKHFDKHVVVLEGYKAQR